MWHISCTGKIYKWKKKLYKSNSEQHNLQKNASVNETNTIDIIRMFYKEKISLMLDTSKVWFSNKKQILQRVGIFFKVETLAYSLIYVKELWHSWATV